MKITTKTIARLELALVKAEARLQKATARYEKVLAKLYIVDQQAIFRADIFFENNLAAALNFHTCDFWQKQARCFGKSLEYIGDRLASKLIRAKLALIYALTSKATLKAKLAQATKLATNDDNPTLNAA